VDSSGKSLARGAGCDEARPRDETWIHESLTSEVVNHVGRWTLPFLLCLLWQDIDGVAEASSLTSNQLQRVNKLLQRFGQRVTLIATYIANNLLRLWNRVRIQMKNIIYTHSTGTVSSWRVSQSES
jgi:hypothetical protein